MLPVFEALFDLDDSKSSFHSMNDIGRCFLVLPQALLCSLEAMDTPRGVSLGDMYTLGTVAASKLIGKFPLARKCFMHWDGRT